MDQEKIYRFFHGTSSQAEARQVLAWLKAKKTEPEVINQIKKYWQETEETQWNADTSWQEFLQKIEDQKLNEGVSSKSSYHELKHYQERIKDNKNKYWLARIAASLLIIFSIGFILWQYADIIGQPASVPAITMLEKTTEKGQKLTVFLKDGTKVILNSESKLAYPQFFDDSLRIVYLTGEAFFQVARNESVPFKVISKAAETTVLGTQFNVNSQEDDKSIVSLVSGSVRVKLTNADLAGEKSVQLKPGESVIANQFKNDLTVTEFDYDETVLWKEGILYFSQASFSKLIEKLENWYGVAFEIEGLESIDTKHFSGKFDNESLRNVLESISFSKNFNYQITGKKVIITFKK